MDIRLPTQNPTTHRFDPTQQKPSTLSPRTVRRRSFPKYSRKHFCRALVRRLADALRRIGDCGARAPFTRALTPGLQRRRRLLFVGVCVLALVGVQPAAAGSEFNAKRELLTESGRYRLEFRAAQDPIPVNEPFAMDVVVRPRHGERPVDHVMLEVEAGMPAHNHGMITSPVVTESGPGRFQVDGMLLHMAGLWRMRFVVRQGLMRDVAEMDLDLPR